MTESMDMNQSQPHYSSSASYDELPYKSFPFTQTHPSVLAGIGRFFALNPPTVSTARVLELGCSSGGNIIPLAIYYPHMHIVGLDYSQKQAQQGMALIANLGLENIEIKHMSIDEVTPEFGLFDYIICHGVYSWVSQEIQQHILRICKENLQPNGIAYVSYNTYPGWKTHEITRDAMLFHTRHNQEGQEKVAHALGMLEMMVELASANSVFGHITTQSLNLIHNKSTDYIFHEYLEEHNQPCYLIDFEQQIKKYGLAYLGDSHLSFMYAQHLSQENRARLYRVCENNQVLFEQYLDFLHNTSFRQSLICHAQVENHINRKPHIDRLLQMEIILPIDKICEEENEKGQTSTVCYLDEGQKINIQTPTINHAVKILAEHLPNAVKAQSLRTAVKQSAAAAFNEEAFNEFLELIYTHDLCTPYVGLPEIRLQKTLPTHPKIHDKIRAFAMQADFIPSPYHHSCTLNDDIILQTIVPLLDGKHTLDDLYAKISQQAEKGKIVFTRKQDDTPLTDIEEIQKEIQNHVNGHLNIFQQIGLLIQNTL